MMTTDAFFSSNGEEHGVIPKLKNTKLEKSKRPVQKPDTSGRDLKDSSKATPWKKINKSHQENIALGQN